VQPAGGAAVQGRRHRGHRRGPAVRPDHVGHHCRAQHISNQFEQAGKSYGAFLFGIENNKDFVL